MILTSRDFSGVLQDNSQKYLKKQKPPLEHPCSYVLDRRGRFFCLVGGGEQTPDNLNHIRE